jgi:hypothetical protein
LYASNTFLWDIDVIAPFQCCPEVVLVVLKAMGIGQHDLT